MNFFSNQNVIHLKEVDSTNDYLKRNPDLWNKNYFTVYTTHQTQGRGRNSRTWFSNPGDDLAFSFIFLSKNKINHLPCISLYVGWAVIKCLSEIIKDRLELKWPNDIIYKNKKLCGILCERIDSNKTNSENTLIIGVGINLNSESFPSAIKEIAISIRQITGEKTGIKKILFKILDFIRLALDNLLIPMSEEVKYQILSFSNCIGSEIKYQAQENHITTSTVIDINLFGELVVKNQNGSIQVISNYRGISSCS